MKKKLFILPVIMGLTAMQSAFGVTLSQADLDARLKAAHAAGVGSAAAAVRQQIAKETFSTVAGQLDSKATKLSDMLADLDTRFGATFKTFEQVALLQEAVGDVKSTNFSALVTKAFTQTDAALTQVSASDAAVQAFMLNPGKAQADMDNDGKRRRALQETTASYPYMHQAFEAAALDAKGDVDQAIASAIPAVTAAFSLLQTVSPARFGVLADDKTILTPKEFRESKAVAKANEDGTDLHHAVTTDGLRLIQGRFGLTVDAVDGDTFVAKIITPVQNLLGASADVTKQTLVAIRTLHTMRRNFGVIGNTFKQVTAGIEALLTANNPTAQAALTMYLTSYGLPNDGSITSFAAFVTAVDSAL